MADDIATLGIEVDSSQVKEAAAELRNYQDVAKRTGETAEQVRTRFKSLNQAVGENSSANKGAAASGSQLETATGAAGKAVGAAGKAVDDTNKHLQQNHAHTVSARTYWRALAHEIALINPELAHVVQHIGFMSVGFAHLGAAVTLITIAIAAISFGMKTAIEEFANAERRVVEFGNALNVVQGSSGQTAHSLEEMSKELAKSGTQSVTSTRQAISELIRFRTIGPEAFKEVLEASKDLSATGFIDMQGAAKALGESLENPIKATDELARAGFRLGTEQQALATMFFNTGRTAEAQRVILDAVSKQARNSDAASADTLSASWTRFKNVLEGVMEKQGEEFTKAIHLKQALDALSTSARRTIEPPSRVTVADNTVAQLESAVAAARTPSRALTAQAARAGITTEELLARREEALKVAKAEQEAAKATAEHTTAVEHNSAAVANNNAAEQARRDRLGEVLKGLIEEAATAGMTATQQATYNAQVKAGVGPAAELEAQVKALTEALNAGGVSAEEAQKQISKLVVLGQQGAQFRGIIEGMKQQASGAEIQAKAVGMSAGAAAQYTAAETARQSLINRGFAPTEEQNALIDQQAARIGKATAAMQTSNLEFQVRLEKMRALGQLSAEEVQVVQRLAPIYGQDIPAALASSLAAQIRLNSRIEEARQLAIGFGQSLVQGFLEGKTAADTLHDSLKSLASTAANATVKNLLEGNFQAAAVSGAVAVGSYVANKIFGGKSQEERQKEEAAAQAAAQAALQKALDQQALVYQSSHRLTLAMQDSSSVQGQLIAKRVQNEDEVVAALQKGLDISTLQVAQAAEEQQMLRGIAKTARENLTEPLSTVQQQLKDIAKNVTDLSAALSYMGQSTEEATRLAAEATQRLRTSFEKDIAAKINAAQGKDYINQVADLIDQIAQMQKDAAALGVNPELIQQLFAVQAQSIVEQANLTGAAFDSLLVQFPQLTDVVHSATDQIKQLGKSIQDYLLSLKFGELSTLSPKAQLDAASQAFEAELAAARAGDQAALANITKSADTLLTTARSFYASSAQYGAIYDQVTSDLSSLAGGGARNGGLLGLAFGGMVPGGLFNVDSVLGRYAGGGNVLLAGGEYVTRAPSVNSRTLPILDQINRTGSANDNSAMVSELRALRQMVLVLVQSSTANAQASSQTLTETRGLRTDIRQSAGEKTLRTALSGSK